MEEPSPSPFPREQKGSQVITVHYSPCSCYLVAAPTIQCSTYQNGSMATRSQWAFDLVEREAVK